MNSIFPSRKWKYRWMASAWCLGKRESRVTVLQDISFDVAQNEFVSLLGPSGCGKSTLLRLMADLLQPSSGQIIIQKEHPREVCLRRKFGIVFQIPRFSNGEPYAKMWSFP